MATQVKMKQIIINSKKYGKHIVLVDNEDYELINQYKWQILIKPNKKVKYARSHSKEDHSKTILMHRIILKLKDGEICDHKDGNGLNNQKSNLRTASVYENSWNKGITINNTTGYKGVCKKPNNRFRSYISVNHKQIFLGTYDTPKEAAKAYNEAALKYHGQFANLNRL